MAIIRTVLFGLLFIGVASALYPNRRNSKVVDAAQVSLKAPPQYSSYIVSGVLMLPYAEIREQFTAFYDPKNNRSRIDYYDGMVKTMQRAETSINSMYKIAYMSTETVYNQLTCFQVNGTAEQPVSIQSAIPDLSSFGYVGTTQYNGHVADQWQFVEQDGTKKNTYTYIVDPVTGEPYYYEMAGYDSLFGSHYDKYYIEYSYYSATMPPVDVFDVPKDLTCSGFPGPGDAKQGVAEHSVQMNPMSEFIGGADQHHDEMFGIFKRQHGKQYATDKEHAVRKSIFRQNVRYIQSTNRAGKSYRVAVNHLADLTSEEMKVLRGFRRTQASPNAQAFNPVLHNIRGNSDIPDTMDWRIYGAVTPVKDQAVCGSCWSFGTAETIEGTYFLKTNNLIRLSQQELMDCSWGEGNNACDGGEDWRAYEWILKHGLTSEEYYGPYLGQDGMCHSMNVTAIAKITGYVNITPGDEAALKAAVAQNGPISVAIDASHKSFSFYANGVYYEPTCGNGPDDLDHAVLAVGYGTLNGQDYWLVKNSWSTYWGNDGYVLMSQKNNNCGVATAATFVTM